LYKLNEVLEKRIEELKLILKQVHQDYIQLEQALLVKKQTLLRVEGALSECRNLLEKLER